MIANYAQHYEQLWQKHWWWQARKHFVLGLIRPLAARKKLHNILDIGCGNGLFFEDLARFVPAGQVRGIEPDAGLVPETSKWRSAIDIRLFDRTFAPQQKPDLVLMLDV